MKVTSCIMAAAVATTLAGCAPKTAAPEPPAPIVHNATGDFPIAGSVVVPAGRTLVFFSGTTPSPAKPDATQNSPEYWGNTETQTLSVLEKIKANLEGQGLGFADVVSMTVYLVADRTQATRNAPARMDFQGMMAAYTKYFGPTSGQPNLPTRSTVEVANLVAPGMLVEIEVTAAK